MTRENTYSGKSSIKTVLSALFLALIAIGAFIKIPLGLVPVTLQFAMVLLTATFSGGRRGALIVGTYILMGLAGLPVFSQGGGPGYILNPTFGYLLGMLICAYVTGTAKEKSASSSFIKSFLTNVLGMIIVYGSGVIYMFIVLNFYMGKNAALGSLVVKGALLFIPTDLLWCAVGAMAELRLKKLTVMTRGNINARC